MKNRKQKFLQYLHIIIIVLFSFTIFYILPHSPDPWGDEVLGGLQFLTSKSYPSFLESLWSLGPEVAPLYPSMLYFLNNNIGYNETLFRRISIFFGILNILVSFFVISQLAGIKLGTLGALVISILPFHLWYSLLLRPHILAFLISSLSILLTIKILKSNEASPVKSYKYILLLVNLMLVLTHYSYLWLPLLEALIILVHKNFKGRTLICILNTLLSITIFLYIFLILRSNNASFTSTHKILELLSITFGVLDFEIQFQNSWSIILQPVIFFGKKVPSLIDKIFNITPTIIIYGGNAIFCVVILFISYNHILNKLKNKDFSLDITLFLIIIGVIFPLTLSILEVLTDSSIVMARYLFPSLLCKVTLILLIIKSSKYRTILTILMVGYFAHNFILYTYTTPYTEWSQCLKKIEKEFSSNDVIITGRLEEALVIVWNKVYLNIKEPPKILYSTSINSTIKGVENLLKKKSQMNIWVIYSNQWNPTLPRILYEEFSQKHLPFKMEIFNSFEGITLLKILSGNNIDKDTQFVNSIPYNCYDNFNWQELRGTIISSILNILNIDILTEEKYKYIVEDLIYPEGTSGIITFPCVTYLLTKKGEYEWAETLCRKFYNQFPIATLAWTIPVIEQDKISELPKILDKLKKQNVYLWRIMNPIIKLYSEKNYTELLKKSEGLKEEGHPLGYLFTEIAKDKISNGENEFFKLGVFPLNF